MRNHAPTYPSYPKVSKPSDRRYLLEINVPDLHLGKLAWGEETGDADYDTEIAQQVFREAVEELLSDYNHLIPLLIIFNYPLGHIFYLFNTSY